MINKIEKITCHKKYIDIIAQITTLDKITSYLKKEVR